ncbi:MAG: class II aldolase/adducin family protein [Chloroflexota bacterium]
MSVEAPYPELDELLELVGMAGRRLSEIDASEGAAGNISVFLGWSLEPRRRFPQVEDIRLPVAVPALAGGTLIVSGSGRRLREIIQEPQANLGVVTVGPGGNTGKLYTSPNRLFTSLTSEFNSHLAVHQDQLAMTATNFHAIIHAQPPHLTYLSNVPRYQDQKYINTHLLRWQPELIVNLPEGVGYVPFFVPGSDDLMAATLEKLRTYRVVVWAKHGAMARSDTSVKRAADRIEYAETAARYEYMNLVAGEQATGLSPEEIRTICAAFKIRQNIF